MTAGWLLNVLLLLAVLPLAALACYLLGLTAAACMHPERRRIDGRYGGVRTARTHFLILIPAHNEELLLGEVLARLRQLTYPADHTTVAVVADNCTDQTAAVAAAAGAQVWERTDPVKRGKGQALDWAMRHRIPALAACEAVVILDADSTVNPDFLWFMQEQLLQGREALQGYYGVQNPLESWRTALATVSLAAFHFLRPLGRDRLGLPCGLKGNGMCFSRRLVAQYGYPAFSVVEDVELALFFLQQGIRVKFVPGAQVLGQMAVSAQAANTQRARWEGGRLALLRRLFWPLLRDGLRHRDGARLDGAMDLLVPPFAILVAGSGVVAAGVVACACLPGGADVWMVTRLLCAAMLAAEGLYVVVSLRLVRAPAGVYVRLAAVPLFLVWKLAVYVRMYRQARRGGAEEWVRTGRTAMKKE